MEYEEVAYCRECLQIVDAPEPCYECSCGATYSRSGSADGNSHRCPDCNKFGSKVTDDGCPDCGAEVDHVMITECPHCGADVLEEDVTENKCPHCGKGLDTELEK